MKNQLKNLYKCLNYSTTPWYVYPLAWILHAIVFATCLLGYHTYDSYLKSGKECMDCGKQKN